jgi:ribonucleoside-triphosphate reductase
MVVEFPCKVPENTPVASSFGWKQQIEIVKRLQAEWSDNSVSCTIYYNKEDLEDIKEYLKENYKDNFKTLSFLLYQGHGFKQAPYETITKEQYEELIKNTRPIHNITVKESDFDIQDCDNGSCPIK